ncbi:hypothetical protein QBC43DRAFT_352665 [Cladorrhinum sp. PSN259]|nr:hypothetical protein QBC43DRAFT_352665 [Cladorrhinum sp. PSN259]
MSSNDGESLSPYEAAVDNTPSAKRRKVRKGTRSCWECKRRKMRCNFTITGDSLCIGCRKRGVPCVSQEFDEEITTVADRGRQMDDRIVRVEALIEKLAHKVGADVNEPVDEQRDWTGKPGNWIDSASVDNQNEARAPNAVKGDIIATQLNSTKHSAKSQPLRHTALGDSKNKHLTEALHAAFPSAENLRIIYESGGNKTVVFSLMMSTPYPVNEREALVDPRALFTRPARNTHPILLARHMLMLSTALQFVHPSVLNLDGLSECPHHMVRRLVDTAVRLVTTNEELLGSVESLHCILLEGWLQANCGNLRRASLAFKRAVSVAQLMGIHRGWPNLPLKVLDPKVGVYAQYMWYRVVMADRILCLMLGLPQASEDQAMASPAALADDTPIGRLERIHTALSSQILEINEMDPSSHDYGRIQELDLKLQKVAEEMTGMWWLPPNFTATVCDQTELFQKMLQLMRQIAHYNLLNQLHFPYILRSNAPASDRSNYEYSRSTCVTASRELLGRFVLFRVQKQVAFCCRSMEFSALMAAMTLLLVHINGHNHDGVDSLLAHQRLSDRAKVESMLENIDCVHEIHSDALSKRSAGLLRCLLTIEANAAGGQQRYAVESIHRTDLKMLEKTRSDIVRVSIPYFGIVKISAESAAARPTSSISHGQCGNPTPLGGGALPSLSLCPARTTAPLVSFPRHQDSTAVLRHTDVTLGIPSAVGEALGSEYQHSGTTPTRENYEDQGLYIDIYDHLMDGPSIIQSDALSGGSWDEFNWRPEL